MRTRIAELTGIQHPIAQGGVQQVDRAEFPVVSEHGGRVPKLRVAGGHRLEALPETSFEDVRPLVAGLRSRAVLASGHVEDRLVRGAKGLGLIDDIPDCADLIDRIVGECRKALSRAATLVA